MVRQFLHASLKRCILYNALHHIIDAVSPSRCFIYVTFVWGFQLPRGKEDLCLGALEDVHKHLVSVPQPGHFLAEYYILSSCSRSYPLNFSLIRPCLLDIQPVCYFQGLFVFHISLNLLDYVLDLRY